MCVFLFANFIALGGYGEISLVLCRIIAAGVMIGAVYWLKFNQKLENFDSLKK